MIFSLCLLLPMMIGSVACGSVDIELSETEIEVCVDQYEGFSFIAGKNFEIKSSDENVAKISSSQRGTGSLSDYVFATIKGVSYGECEVMVTVGRTTETIKVTVGFVPELTLQQTSHYGFHIQTNLPAGTILKVSLSGNGYNSSKEITLEKQTWYFSHQAFTFGEDLADGTYSLSVGFADFENQTQGVKDILGAHGEFVLGENVKQVNGTKTLEITYSVTVPYLTTEEKIAATDYSKLTTAQKKYIKQWIDARYDYYDDITGKYQGDRFTETIFAEAAELFSKTKTQISAIWSDPNILLYE